MAVTQKDIAEQLGISRVLVSYALNGHPRVSEATRQRVREAARRLGYRPNRTAQALVTGRTGQIIFRSFSQSSTSVYEFSRQLMLCAQQSKYELLVGVAPQVNPAMALPAADGAIFMGNVPKSLQQQGFPAVSVQIDLRGPCAGHIGDYDVLQIAHEAACRQAVEHLVREGYQRIAYVSSPIMMGVFEPRYRAYAAVMQNSGRALEEIPVVSLVPFGLRHATHHALREYSQQHGFPDALFCSCDDIAIGAYRALREAGRHIPQETAVIGGDDMDEARDHQPALSSIRWPFDAVCRRAWQMLMERLAEPKMPPRFERIQAQFVPRASSQVGSTPSLSTPGAAAGELFSR